MFIPVQQPRSPVRVFWPGEKPSATPPINGLLLAAQRHRLRAQLLKLCNADDTAGDKDRIVGYVSFTVVQKLPDEP